MLASLSLPSFEAAYLAAGHVFKFPCHRLRPQLKSLPLLQLQGQADAAVAKQKGVAPPPCRDCNQVRHCAGLLPWHKASVLNEKCYLLLHIHWCHP